MACNCGGGAAYPVPTATAIAAGVAVMPAAQAWDVTFPNGTTMRYHQQWKAHQAQALSGGTIKEVGPVKDVDRERVVDLLQQAVGRGVITLDEFHVRSARAVAARTHADLSALTADLPGDLRFDTPNPGHTTG